MQTSVHTWQSLARPFLLSADRQQRLSAACLPWIWVAERQSVGVMALAVAWHHRNRASTVSRTVRQQISDNMIHTSRSHAHSASLIL